MAVDLTGGIDPAREQMFAERPDNPEMRDSVSFWVSDDRGEVGLPRVGIEAVAANWQAHGYQINVAFPDGRVLRVRDDGTSWPVEDPDGRPMVIGAGGLGFRCVEPFRTWTMTYDGAAVETSSFDLADGKKDGPLVDVQFEVEATMAVPPWVQGTLVREAGAAARDLHRRRPHGWAALRAALPRHRASAAWRARSTSSRAAACASAAKASAGSRASGVIAGSRRCSPAGRRSAAWRTHRATTASPRSTKVSSTTAPATSSRPDSSTHPGSRSSSRSARTSRWVSRPRTARYGSKARRWSRRSTSRTTTSRSPSKP